MTDGQDISAASGQMYAMGSFAVMPGCTMYQYLGTSYTGERCVVGMPEFKFKPSPKLLILRVKSKMDWGCQYNIMARLKECQEGAPSSNPKGLTEG